MTFTTENTNYTDRSTLEIINIAADEAWGAVKGYFQRINQSDDAEYCRDKINEAILDNCDDVRDSELLAEIAVRSCGLYPARTVFSLEARAL